MFVRGQGASPHAWVRGPIAAVALAAAAFAAWLGAGCAQLAGLTDHQPYPVLQISAGQTHACALLRTGDVWCWGANDLGQLGHRTADDGGDCTMACPAAPVEGISGVLQVSAGAGFTCAVTSAGDVQCWGRNTDRELGRATPTMCGQDYCDPTPAAVGGVPSAVQVSAGGGFACARTSVGDVWCWGDNSYAELGRGDFGTMVAPGPVPVITKAVDVSAALTGANTCVAIADGTTVCWGLNVSGGTGHAQGTMGDTPNTDMPPLSCSTNPVAVSQIKGATGVRTGDLGACALLGTGEIDCWGYDGLGTLGTAFPAMGTTVLPPSKVTLLPQITGFDLRSSTACAIDPNGAAWCWGQAGVGALGPAKTNVFSCDQGVLCQKTAGNVGLQQVTQIAAGVNLSLALLDDGQVMAWGINNGGQLGHAPKTLGDITCPADPTSVCNATPLRVQGLPP